MNAPMSGAHHWKATATKEGGWWEITVEDLEHVTSAKRMGEVEDYARSLIAITRDIPESTVSVDVTYAMPTEIDTAWKQARADVKAAEEATLTAARRCRDIVLTLRADGWTDVEIAAATGLSKQRIGALKRQQLD